MEYQNLSAAVKAPVGPKRDADGYFARDFYIYETDTLSIAPGANVSLSFGIQADADFLWQKATYFADIALANQTDDSRVIPLCTVGISETGSGRNLMNSAVPIASLFGTGQIPFILPRARRFVANSQVTVNVTNFSAATTYAIRLSFIGEKGFK